MPRVVGGAVHHTKGFLMFAFRAVLSCEVVEGDKSAPFLVTAVAISFNRASCRTIRLLAASNLIWVMLISFCSSATCACIVFWFLSTILNIVSTLPDAAGASDTIGGRRGSPRMTVVLLLFGSTIDTTRAACWKIKCTQLILVNLRHTCI